MADNNSLIEIIAPVEGKIPTLKRWQKVLILDRKGERILDREPSFLSRISSSRVIVANCSNGLFANHATPSFLLEEFGRKRTLEIRIISQVGCREGMEADVVKALVLGKHAPGLALSEYIREWIFQFIDKSVGPNMGAFIDGLDLTYGNALLDDLRARSGEIGIVFRNIDFEINGNEFLRNSRIELKGIETNFRDSVEKHSFSITAILSTKNDHRIKAIATHKRDSDLEKIVSDELVNYIPKNVDFEAFASDREDITEKFREHLNKRFAVYGREVGALQVEAAEILSVPRILKKSFITFIEVPEFPEKVRIESQILVKRVDIARFSANKPEDFEAWLKSQFEDSVKDAFFGLKYSQIRKTFDERKVLIENELRTQVGKVGYDLEQIIVIPSFIGLDPLEKIEVVIDKVFTTHDQEQVKLKVSVNFSINQFEKINHYIDNNRIKYLKQDLEEMCFQVIEKSIHSLNVKDFYKSFDFPEETPNELSVRATLIQRVGEKATENFGAEISYIFFDRGEDEVIEKMNLLKRGGWKPFEASITSVIDFGMTVFSGSFLVEGGDLELWQIFRNQDITIENLRKAIENALSSQLAVKPSGFLAYKDEASYIQVNEMVAKTAIQSIRSDYGINIRMNNSSRGFQDRERLMGIEMRTLILESVASLQRDLLEAASIGDREREQEIENRLSNLQDRIKNLDANQLSPGPEKALSAAKADEIDIDIAEGDAE